MGLTLIFGLNLLVDFFPKLTYPILWLLMLSDANGTNQKLIEEERTLPL